MFIFTFPLLVFFFFSLFLGGMLGGGVGGAGVGGGIEVEMSIQVGLSGSG